MIQKNTWVWLVVIIVIVIAYFVGQNHGSSNSPQTIQTADTNIVPTSTQTAPQVQTKNIRSTSEILANKTTCATYKDKINKDINQVVNQYDIPVIYKVFYSQSLNTCLDERYDLYPAHGTIAEGEVLRIDDVLTGGNVWTSQVYSPALKYWDAESILDQQSTLYN